MRHKEYTIQTYTDISKIPYGHASSEITPGCIVLEGGAFRGLYNQGVLDALMKNDINFACTIGTSAGALAGFNYTAGLIGRSARVNFTYRHYTDYVGWGGALNHAHSPVRLTCGEEWILYHIEQTKTGFAVWNEDEPGIIFMEDPGLFSWIENSEGITIIRETIRRFSFPESLTESP